MYANPIQCKIMTEPNLQPSWPSYQLQNMYCLHKSGEVLHNFREKQLYILHRSQFNEACTKFDEKPVVHLPR